MPPSRARRGGALCPRGLWGGGAALQTELDSGSECKARTHACMHARTHARTHIHTQPGLEKDIAGLKREIRERDDALGDKERRIHELKKKNQVRPREERYVSSTLGIGV